jgi:hypothetical protein
METRKNLFFVLGEWWDARQASRVASHTRPSRVGRLARWLVPNGGTLLIVALLLLTQSLWARPFQAPASAPGASATTVNYQGRLADNAGVPLDGTYGMTFALYDEATGGNLIWGPEAHTAVPVSEGLFSVGLGSNSQGGIPTTTWNGDRYLEITVGGETLSPRELIRSVPIAGMALTVPDGVLKSHHVHLTSDTMYGDPGFISLNTTRKEIPGLTFSVNPTTAQVLQVIVTLDAKKSSSSSVVVANLYVDGSGRGRPIVLEGDNLRATVSTSTQVNLPPGPHTISVKARVESGSGSIITTENSVLSYIMFSQ